MIFFGKIVLVSLVTLGIQLIFAEGAWAWGPAVHTVIASRMLGELGQLLPPIAQTIQSFPMEYLYGSLAADFFVGKGQKPKEGHSHNWETGFRFLKEAKDNQEAAYAYGFLSHLAADVIAHNYFVPKLIQRAPAWKRMGHLYWEAVADCLVGPVYIRIANEVLSNEKLGCDEQLKAAVGKKRPAIKARRRLFTQSVKLSDYFSSSQSRFLMSRGLGDQVSPENIGFMLDLSYRLAKDFLIHPESSPCVSYDPIGSRNLLLASRKAILSRLFKIPRRNYRFRIDQELLEV